VVDRYGCHREATELQRLVKREPAQVGRQNHVGEEHASDLEHRDRPLAPEHRDVRVGMVGEAVVVEVRVREDDGRDVRRRRVVGEDAGDIAQHVLCDQLDCRSLRRAAREVAAARRHERHAQVKQHARTVIGGHLDAHAADLVLPSMDDVMDGPPPQARPVPA